MSDRKKTISKENEEPKEEVQETAFSKEQILASQKYPNRRDLVNALLEDSKKYTITEVEQKINTFLKGKVK